MAFDAHEIVPGLWQGSLPLAGSSVKGRGFTQLVLCARELQPPAGDYPGVEVIYAPNDDHPDYGPLDREKLRVAIRAAKQVAKGIRNGGQALVTCAAGANRSGLVSGLVLHMLLGWSGDQAVSQIRRKRKVKKGYKPLTNAEFTAALRTLPARPVPQLAQG
jgi:hypothetical protein